jgi:uncharacterized membrane protein YedE/YeeE
MSGKQSTSLIAGLIFGVGLILSGVTQPQKVVGFLDLFGNWDPSLAFVMIGAIGVHALAYATLIKPRRSPMFEERFHLKQEQRIDGRLLMGAAIFGVGWGLGGFCPGPGIVSLGTGSLDAIVFVVGMLGGMFIFRVLLVKPVKEAPSKEDLDVPCG